MKRSASEIMGELLTSTLRGRYQRALYAWEIDAFEFLVRAKKKRGKRFSCGNAWAADRLAEYMRGEPVKIAIDDPIDTPAIASAIRSGER